MKKSIRQLIEGVLPLGTRIVSFEYNGKARNVVVGVNAAIQGDPTWGTQVNRAIRKSDSGREYLVGLVRNEENPQQIKAFALDKIKNLSLA